MPDFYFKALLSNKSKQKLRSLFALYLDSGKSVGSETRHRVSRIVLDQCNGQEWLNWSLDGRALKLSFLVCRPFTRLYDVHIDLPYCYYYRLVVILAFSDFFFIFMVLILAICTISPVTLFLTFSDLFEKFVSMIGAKILLGTVDNIRGCPELNFH